jgi:FkbM family methyltransferase
MDVYVRHSPVRNPFRVVELPFLARAYRYRKGLRRTFGQQLVRTITPSNLFVKAIVSLAGQRSRGTFAYRYGNEERQISFRVSNTQYHALYFPQYAAGYEPETTCLVDTLFAWNPTSVFFDIGANWGFYSLFAASAPAFGGSVHAFEPVPATFKDLADVVRQAGLQHVIDCHELALADEDGAGAVRLADGVTSGTASVARQPQGKMRLAALDSLGLPQPDVLKVDVEGFEAEVFLGAARTLRAAQPMIVFESWLHPGRPSQTLRPFRLLAALGYRFFEPALLCGEGADQFLAGFGKSPPPEIRRGLALAEFVPEQRTLLDRHLNVFACHESRCDDFLDANFERLENAGPRPKLRVAC